MVNDLPPGFRVVSAPQAQPAQARAPVSDLPPGFRVVSAPQPGAAPAMPAAPRAEDRNFAQRNFSDPVGRGFNQLQQNMSSAAYQTGFMSAEDYAAALIRDEQDMAQYPAQPEMQARVQRIADSEGVMQGIGRGLMDPAAIWNVTLESLPNMLPSLAGGVAGAVAGAPLGPVGLFAGRAAGSGAASAVTEYGNVITEMVQERGGALTEENILLALQDEALMAEADRRGKARGLGIGIWDAISFGIAGKPFSAARKATGSRAAGVGAELAVQAGAEGAGEATAQVFDKGEVDRPGEVALEALSGGLTGAVVEVPTAVLTDRAAQPREPDVQQPVQPPVPPVPPAGPGVPPATPPAGPAPVGAGGVAGAPAVPAGQPVEGSDGAARAGGGSAPDPAANQPGAVQAQTPPAQGQGQPAPAAQPAPLAQNPRRREVTYGDNQKIETEFELVDLDTLVAASGDLQPRDRTRDTSDEQIAQIAGNLDPSRLLDSAEADRGAPIVGPDNVIESGNGRIQALRRAAEMFPERYEAYRQAVLDSGFAEANDQLKRPVLVRRRVTPFDDNQRRDFVVAANRPATLAMSATERAKADRDALTDDVLDRLVVDASAGLRAASNRDFVRAFVSKLPQTERGSLLDANGQLSQEGERRLQGAVLTRAYGDDGTVAQQLEATDDNAKAISGALLDAAGAWAQLVRAVKAGDVKPEFDTTKDLMRAVAIVRQARESGEKVLDLVNQGDAFDPVSDTTRELVRSFFRDDGLTKAAGRARVAEALTRYVREAKQQTSGPNLLGETAPPVTPADVARVARSPQQTSMFGGEETPSQPRQQAAEDVMFDESDPFADIEADDKRGLGGLGPNMARVSQTNRGSNFENAFVAMGENPDEMRARPAGEQIARLLKFVQDTFGFASVARKGPQGEALAVDARDSLLDLYRNGQFMSHVLALPQKALGLLNTLSINFERDKSRYFGAYYPGQKMIALPGRTNSFAHEWMHALDHFLNEKLNGRPEMLSQLAKDEGLDTAKTLEGAFVNVLNALFFDQAAVAQRMLTLQAEASEIATQGPNKGKPTQKALNAQEQIDKLAKGNSQIKGADSKYAQRVKDFAGGNPYWTNPAEMIARAFEAYVAMKVEADGGSNEVITKGNEAYLSDADARLRDTFPKLGDRANIFRAFDGLFDVLRDAEILGVGVAPKPDEHGTLQPNYWAKQAAAAARLNPTLYAQLKSEASRMINLLRLDRGTREEFMEEMRDRVGLPPAGSDAPRVPLRRRLARGARALYWSMRSMMQAAVDRNGDAGIWGREFVVDKLATDPGRGRAIGETFEDGAERNVKQWVNRMGAAVRASGVKERNRPKDQVKRLRALALGDDRKTVPGATDAEVKLAAELRRILDDLFREAQAAGIDVNFVGETVGYLKRTIQRERVYDNPDKFVEQARKVYEVVFDQDVGDPVDVAALAEKLRTIDPNQRPPALVAAVGRMRDLRKKINALSKQLATSTAPNQVQAKIDALVPDLDVATKEVAALTRDLWSDTAAKDWLTRLQTGSSMDFTTRGPDSKFTQSRTLPDEADKYLADFYMTDPIDVVADYIHDAVRKIKFAKLFGNVTGNDKIENIARRNAKAIERSPKKYSLSTSEGRRNILRDFGDPSQDSFGETALREMAKEGAEPSDIDLLRKYWETITGRVPSKDVGPIGDIATGIYAAGSLAILPRSMWASLAEVTAMYLRTGSGKATFTTFAALVREAFRGAQSVQELAALTEYLGITTDALNDTVNLNRMTLNNGDTPAAAKFLTSFFRRIGLTQLTNASRRASVPGGWVWLRELAIAINKGRTNRGDERNARLAERELLELGIPAESVNDFANFVLSNPKLPSIDDFATPAGELAAIALNRLVSEVIQNPMRVDKPLYTGTPIGRLAYAVMSFAYKFFRSTVLRAYYSVQTRAEVNREMGMSKVTAAAEAAGSIGLKFATGAAALILAQMLVSVAREAIFNGDKWEEEEKKDNLAPWLLRLGFSRSGLLGPADVLVQSYTGLRYQRDLTNLYAGPHLGYFTYQAQRIGGLFVNNSPDSNTSEWNAVKAGYLMLGVPALSLALSALPGGPVTGPLAGMALQGVTSNKAADSFANAVVGEKDTRRDP
jgi:hypothetical protein